MNLTGMAPGKLSPIIYFENSKGEIALPPSGADAHWLFHNATNREGQSCALKNQGWEWREASTLREVDALQERLQALQMEQQRPGLDHHQEIREAVKKKVASDLYARMYSAASSEMEKEFIRKYLELSAARRDKYRDQVEQAISYLHVREFDSSTKATDRIRD